MPHLYVLFRVNTTVNTVPTCKLTTTASPFHVFPTSYCSGIGVGGQVTDSNGRIYHIRVEIDTGQNKMELDLMNATFDKVAAEQARDDRRFLPAQISARSQIEVSNGCVGYEDVANNKWTWVMLVSVEVRIDDKPSSNEVVGSELREEDMEAEK